MMWKYFSIHLVSHDAVGAQKVWAVEAPRHGAGLAGLAAGAVGALQPGVLTLRWPCCELCAKYFCEGYLDPAHAVVGQEAGDAAHAELAVGVAGGAGDLLGVLLAPLQTRLAEGVETWQHLHTKCFR